MRTVRLVPLALGLLIAGCAEGDAPDPDPVPQNDGYQLADPVDPLEGGRTAAGEWAITGDGEIRYGTGEGAPITVKCDERQGLLIEIAPVRNLPPIEMLRVSTAGASGLYAVLPIARDALRAAIPAGDPMIARLAEGAPVVLGYGTEGEIELPAGQALPRLIEKCRPTAP